MTDRDESAHMGGVDANEAVHRATETDEEQVLRDVYGDPDTDGVYRGGEGEL